MPAYVPTAAEIEREQLLVNEEVWQGERVPLHRTLAEVRTAATDYDLLMVQARMLGRMKARQTVISELRAELKSLGRQRVELADQKPKPIAELRELMARIGRVERRCRAQEALHHLWLGVGDALMWRRLGYDRAAITVLGLGSPVGWLSDAKGWDAETAAIDQCWEQDGILCLLTDATRCVNTGDLICFPPGLAEVREVKAGRAVPVDSPQMRRMREAVNLINLGRAEHDGHDRVMIRAHRPYCTHLAQLPLLIAKATIKGQVVHKVSAAQLVVVSDFTQPLARSRRFGEDEARAAASWATDDVILSHGTTIRRMRDRKDQFPYLAPLSILPISVTDTVRVMIGELDITTWINISAVAADLRRRGWLAQPIAGPASAHGFVNVAVPGPSGRRATQLTVAPHLREMMATELMTLASLHDAVRAVFNHALPIASPDTQQRVVVPANEQRVWHRAYT